MIMNSPQIAAEAVGFAVAEVCRTALGFAGGRKWLQGGNSIGIERSPTTDFLESDASKFVGRLLWPFSTNWTLDF